MKNLVFMFVAFATISFVSCGLSTSQGPTVDSDTIIIDDNSDSLKTANDSINDSTRVDTDSANIVKE